MEMSINTIAVIGAGSMGAGIAQVAAQSGFPVYLFDLESKKAEQAKSNIATILGRRVDKGRMSQQNVNEILNRITCTSLLSDIADVSMVIEAIIENLEAKQSLIRDIESICSKECIFATNTSSISITAIASAAQFPERVVGLHFFNPAPVMKLVEVISGIATSNETAARAQAWATYCGKDAVLARSTPGFIVNRVARPFYAEALRALEAQVASVDVLDYIMRESGGFNMGPFELMDLIGNDVNYAVTKSVFDTCYQDRRYQPSLAQKELVDAGYFGRKSGRGFYNYADEEATKPLPFTNVESLGTHNVLQVGHWQDTHASFLKLIGTRARKPDSKSTQLAMLNIDGVCLVPTMGKTASDLSHQLKAPVVMFDYCLDYQTTPVITLAPAIQNTNAETERVVAFVQSLNKQVLMIKDYPGMVVWRTISMLANEAVELSNQGGATFNDIDKAMKSGVNYPKGPIEWGAFIGWNNLLSTLNSLTEFYAEERYRPSPLLRQLSYIERKEER